MIILKVETKALPKKREEFMQTLAAIAAAMPQEKGCLSCNAYQHIEEENRSVLFGEWQSQEDLDRYFRSHRFSALLGTKPLLTEAPEVAIIPVSYMAGIEAVIRAKGE